MNWRDIEWNVVTLGRLAGIGIIVAGIVLAMLDASALSFGSSLAQPGHARLRYFLGAVTGYAWKGGLIFAAAEIADRFGWGDRGAFDWRGARFLVLLGLAVIVIGVALTGWSIYEERHLAGTSGIVRAHMAGLIGSVWSGGVLLLAAALADRIGWPETDTDEHVAEAPA